ncbi:hypothetical protein COCOR_07220 [Corallococcus coralloides DSM 2259]|uniref:Uncharacterized protein n=1 Tax=Corallococcus coralloides (strain ATCC 25202 / DSM 2259 / NBRC 100086 / M2) TaxID=1144275 RepID=H8MJT6_CORCM|nr:hypothetical protein [Corallococcus coralloides]AFE07403.1 hypothetical protein COCOR_07220 [Corallococcus coralloides DSM 2259]
MHPAYLFITKVVCNATDDTFGADDLYGILGNDTFPIGQFKAGDQKDLTVERPIPPGVNGLTIAESDFPGQNDVLDTIDLLQNMDVERVIGILVGDARYDITFRVISAADDATEERCPETCPTCGDGCRKQNPHGGTVHWCGRHEWGAN